MGPPPMGGPPPQARQGTSRMVPVVVSAGLAVGVFCGLLFGLGTGQSNAAPAAPVSNGVKRTEDPALPESVRSTVRSPEPPKAAAAAGSNAGSGSAVAVAAGSAATGSAGSAAAAGSAAPADGSNAASAEPLIAKLIVEIKPDMAGPTAKVTVDDKEIAGLETEIPMEPSAAKKKVKVKVRALGFRDVEQTVEVEVAGETTLKLELIKGRSSLPATPVAGNAGSTGNTGATAATGNTGTTGNTGKTAATSTGKTEGTNGTKANTGSRENTGTKANTGNKGNKGKGKGNGGLIDI